MRNKMLKTAIHYAAEDGFDEIIELLIHFKGDVHVKDRNGNTPLHVAASRDRLKTVQLLLERGSEVNGVNTYRDTPLHLSCAEQHIDLALLLVEKGGDLNMLNCSGKTPLDLLESSEDKAALLASTLHSKLNLQTIESYFSACESGSLKQIQKAFSSPQIHTSLVDQVVILLPSFFLSLPP